MIDYQRIVEFLRDFRATPGQPVTDEVRRYAGEYAQRCAQANERLRQCSVFLQQGLRSEAIHLADESPNLLDLVAALDLPDAPAWTEFCQQNDLPAPPPLQTDRAGRLNDAYEQEQPVENLLRRHRRMALSRAPIKDRLETMRRLAAADTGSSFWEKDLRLFEKARHKELKMAFTAAVDAKDAAALAALATEVLKTAWLEVPGADLVSAAQGADEHMRMLAADTQLQECLTKLRTAFAARDYAQSQVLVQQIYKLGKESRDLGMDNDTAAELKPILTWIRQEDALLAKRRAAEMCQQQLRNLLDADAADKDLEAGYEKLRGMNEAIPPDLAERYQQTLRRRNRAATRKLLLTLASVGAVLVLVIAAVYFILQQRNAGDWAARIHQAVVARDLDRAQRLVADQERIAPKFNNDATVAAAKQEVVQLRQKYEADSEEFKQVMGQLLQGITDAKQTLGKPGPGIGELLLAAQHDEKVVEDAPTPDRLEWIDVDHKLKPAIEQLRNLAKDLRKQANDAAMAQAQSITQRIDQIAVGVTSDGVKSALERTNALDGEIDTLRRIGGLDKITTDAIADLNNRLAAKRDQLTKGLDRAQRLVALQHRVNSVDSWKKELQEYVDAFPDAAVSADFKQAIANSDSLSDIEAMSALTDSWAGKYAATAEAPARQRLDAIKAYLTAHPRSAYHKAADAYAAYLTQAADALAVKGTWQKAYEDLLGNQLIHDLAFLMDSDNTRYLVLGDIHLKIQQANSIVKISFEVMNPADPAKHKLITLPESTKLTSDKPQPMPHAKYAQALSAQLKNITADNWDTYGITLIDQLAHDQTMDHPDMEPVVRAILLQQALRATVQVSGWGVGDKYNATIDKLAKQEVDGVVWYDNDKPIPQTLLDALKKIIDDLPKTEEMLKTLKDTREGIFKDVNCHYTQMGILMKNETGEWTIYPAAAPAGSRAWTVGPLPQAADQPAPLVQVAHEQDGKFKVDDAAANKLPQGTVVFIGQ